MARPREPLKLKPSFTELLLLLSLILFPGHLSATPRDRCPSLSRFKATYLRHLPFKDVIFTSDVLLEVTARSKVECGLRCVETGGCRMVTFQGGGGVEGVSGRCRIHGKTLAGSEERLPVPGARSYYLPDIPMGQCCNSTAQCETSAKCTDQYVCGPRSCPDAFTERCGRCFRGIKANLNFNNAMALCKEKYRGWLVMTKTLTDMACVQTFLQQKNIGLAVVWIGANSVNEQYLWTDGSQVPEDSDMWYDKDQREYGKCLILGRTKSGLIEHECESTFDVLCEKDL
ncbi:hypothetical protein ACOMHN_067701 [Nucella lapillus]